MLQTYTRKMMKTTALLALVALSSFSASRAQPFDVDSFYSPDMEMAEEGTGCEANAPAGANPANVIIAGGLCYGCIGSAANFNFGDDEAFNEDSVGCSCEDGSSCVTWEVVTTEVNADEFFDDE